MRYNLYRKGLVLGFILILLLLSPLISAISIQEETNKELITTPETNEEIKNNAGTFGRVSGMVHTAGFPPYTEISGAKIVLEGDLIKRITFSGILGFYRFIFLEIGRPYKLTVTHPRYETVIETFTISADKPHIYISFPMYLKDELDCDWVNSNLIHGI
jgi:hypothetical protein